MIEVTASRRLAVGCREVLRAATAPGLFGRSLTPRCSTRRRWPNDSGGNDGWHGLTLIRVYPACRQNVVPCGKLRGSPVTVAR